MHIKSILFSVGLALSTGVSVQTAVVEAYSSIIANSNAQVVANTQSILNQLAADATVRANILQEEVTQTAYQLRLMNDTIDIKGDLRKEFVHWSGTNTLPSNALTPYYEQMMEQVAQQYALTQFTANLADLAGTYYPGLEADLKDMTPSTLLQGNISSAASLVDTAKGVLYAGSATQDSLAKSEGIALMVDGVVSDANISMKELVQLLVVVANDNARQMAQFRTEVTNFTTLMASKIALETQKQLTTDRLAYDALQAINADPDIEPAPSGKASLLSTNASLKAPSQLGWGLQSPYVTY